MHSANLWRSLSSRYASWIRVGSAALLISSALLGLDLAAQSPANSDRAEQPAATPASPAPNYTPNYALEARFLPANLNKLVFDLSVTPHWFTLSDKFWYTYRTSSGAYLASRPPAAASSRAPTARTSSAGRWPPSRPMADANR